MIRLIGKEELPQALEVIHRGFATAAEEFHLTRENCPTNGAFMPPERLQADWDKGIIMAAAEEDEQLVGFAAVLMQENGCAELEKLSVLPEWRHRGIGAALVDWAKQTARDQGAERMSIGIIEENGRLKEWYRRLGFVHIGTHKFEFLPFIVGYMEMKL